MAESADPHRRGWEAQADRECDTDCGQGTEEHRCQQLRQPSRPGKRCAEGEPSADSQVSSPYSRGSQADDVGAERDTTTPAVDELGRSGRPGKRAAQANGASDGLVCGGAAAAAASCSTSAAPNADGGTSRADGGGSVGEVTDAVTSAFNNAVQRLKELRANGW
jgi:hypothetical protein